MFVIEFLAKLLKILRSAASPNQIAWGFTMGMIIGLTPFWSLHNILLILLIIILKVNLAMAIFSFAIFSGVAYLFDPLFHNFGYFLLVDLKSLKPIWTSLYNFPLVALSRYNNTVVMGSFIVALISIVPIFFLSKRFVFYYREKLDPKFQKLKIVKMIKGSTVYSYYEKIKGIGV